MVGGEQKRGVELQMRLWIGSNTRTYKGSSVELISSKLIIIIKDKAIS